MNSRWLFITPRLDDPWVTQIERNVTYVDDGFLCGKAYLILDRDTKYSGGDDPRQARGDDR